MAVKRVVFRVDASVEIGSGHVMRCLTLAKSLRSIGFGVEFVTRRSSDNKANWIKAQGFNVYELPKISKKAGIKVFKTDQSLDAQQTIACLGGSLPEWLVVDHYGLSKIWESSLRPIVKKLMVIDDLADRPHDCDLILDQNFFPNAYQRYEGLVPVYCYRLTGPEFFLLRSEFKELRSATVEPIRSKIFVYFGNKDEAESTESVLEAIVELGIRSEVDVLLGKYKGNTKNLISKYRIHSNIHFHTEPAVISNLLCEAKLCIGTGGIITFERIALRVPSIVVAVAKNQYEPLKALSSAGVIDFLGYANSVSPEMWRSAIKEWLARKTVSKSIQVGTDVGRLIDLMSMELVRFGSNHIKSTFEILQDAKLRRDFAMHSKPEWNRHVKYWETVMVNSDALVYAIEKNGEHIGNCGIKPVPNSTEHEAWIYLSSTVEKRTGVGEFAFRQLLKIATQTKNLTRILLHVKKKNEAAQNLYKKIGFTPTIGSINQKVWGDRSKDMHMLMIQL